MITTHVLPIALAIFCLYIVLRKRGDYRYSCIAMFGCLTLAVLNNFPAGWLVATGSWAFATILDVYIKSREQLPPSRLEQWREKYHEGVREYEEKRKRFEK